MQRDERIYVAGHTGLAGGAILRKLKDAGHANIAVRTHGELDLTDSKAVQAFFEREQPQYVFIAAARVGGINANNSFPADFIYQNLAIQMNLLHNAYLAGVKKLLFLGSSCIYPRDCPQPMKEEYLLTGPLEATNRPYAVAKIAGVEMCWAYNRQYGTRFMTAMPTNLFGPGDHYDLSTSHVLPAIIRKTHEAKVNGASLEVWGTGTPRREFLYSDDMADACLFLMSQSDEVINALFGRDNPPLVNLGWGKDISIKELADIIVQVIGFKGEIHFNPSMPDGTTRKLMDVTRIKQMGWSPRIKLIDGIRQAYDDFLLRYSNLKH